MINLDSFYCVKKFALSKTVNPQDTHFGGLLIAKRTD